jgi:glycosyltransferase involved in cell wall biosynthesis
LVPRGDSGSLARAIGALAAEPERLRAMGERGRARLREHFTMERMAAANEDFYYDLLEADERG